VPAFGAALKAELAASQPQLLAMLQKRVPDMVPKAYRWVAEMEEIAAYFAGLPSQGAGYEGAARLYEKTGRRSARARQAR